MNICTYHRHLPCTHRDCPFVTEPFATALEKWSIEQSSPALELVFGGGLPRGDILQERINAKCEVGKLLPPEMEYLTLYIVQKGGNLLKTWQMREVCEMLITACYYYLNPEKRAEEKRKIENDKLFS